MLINKTGSAVFFQVGNTVYTIQPGDTFSPQTPADDISARNNGLVSYDPDLGADDVDATDEIASVNALFEGEDGDLYKILFDMMQNYDETSWTSSGYPMTNVVVERLGRNVSRGEIGVAYRTLRDSCNVESV